MNGSVAGTTVLAAGGSSSGSGLATLLPLLLLVVAFYFLVIRPGRNRQRQAANLQSSLAVGQEVMTSSGLYGRIIALEDDAVVLETSPGVTMRWAKAAVARVVTPVDAPPADARLDSDETGDEAGTGH